MAAFEALQSLAEEFVAAGAPLQALKCLEAAVGAELSPPPLVEVRARLRLATLLLRHADAAGAAKAHLERAQVVVQPLRSCDELKCAVVAALAEAYGMHGAAKHKERKAALRKGADIASANRKKVAPAHRRVAAGRGAPRGFPAAVVLLCGGR